MPFIHKPYRILILGAILTFIVGQLLIDNSFLDIHLHDKYFVFSSTNYIWFPTVLLLILWILYKTTNKLLYSQQLSWIHILLSTFLASFFAISPYVLSNSYEGLAGMPRRYLDFEESSITSFFRKMNKTEIIIFSILIFGQLLYLVNLTLGLLRKPIRENNR